MFYIMRFKITQIMTTLYFANNFKKFEFILKKKKSKIPNNIL